MTKGSSLLTRLLPTPTICLPEVAPVPELLREFAHDTGREEIEGLKELLAICLIAEQPVFICAKASSSMMECKPSLAPVFRSESGPVKVAGVPLRVLLNSATPDYILRQLRKSGTMNVVLNIFDDGSSRTPAVAQTWGPTIKVSFDAKLILPTLTRLVRDFPIKAEDLTDLRERARSFYSDARAAKAVELLAIALLFDVGRSARGCASSVGDLKIVKELCSLAAARAALKGKERVEDVDVLSVYPYVAASEPGSASLAGFIHWTPGREQAVCDIKEAIVNALAKNPDAPDCGSFFLEDLRPATVLTYWKIVTALENNGCGFAPDVWEKILAALDSDYVFDQDRVGGAIYSAALFLLEKLVAERQVRDDV